MSPAAVQKIFTERFEIDPNIKEKDGHTYFVSKRIHNYPRVEIVFKKDGKLKGCSEIVDALKSEGVLHG